MITKAEILFSRKCDLNCHYCNMVTGKSNSRSIEEWKLGIDNLKKLGVDFCCFYGAEPMLEFEKLGPVIAHAEKIGIHTTIITSGVVPEFKEKIRQLKNWGLKSLSMSYDIVPLDPASKSKTKRTIEHLLWFKSLPNCRDVAAITTLTRTNFRKLPSSIKENTALGIWTFFDFIHPDRGQSGSKCKGNGEGLIFLPEDYDELHIVLQEVLNLKEQGYLVHVSKECLDLVSRNNFDALKNYNWNCARHEEFPSWVTIDYDGSVHYCDDFMEKRRKPKFDMTTLYENWDSFSEYGRELVTSRCRGCVWSTHIDSHLVKNGTNPIESYVHGIGE